ncbi:MAG TPA: NAD(P)/FAD-dependent oxidoreductase [Caulobacterales bacterium]|nr:NAD(P)/FAD-dependent oxidoreductase [Caulobacterales bacterium]
MSNETARTNVAASPDVDVAIAGAGFSGLGMAIALKREGKRSFVVLEKAGAVGGTWRDNRYPGCACDIPSNLYSFSFAPNPNWTRLFPTQAEIWAYLERCADAFGVRPHLRFNAAVKRAAWDDAQKLWRIETADGKMLTARAFVSGMGGLHVPHMPELSGLDSFKGQSWHSARWRDDVPLAGKRVAVIGTGASAIQIVPEIAPIVAKLDLYQRTPPWIVPKHDRAVSESERALFKNAPVLQDLKRRFVYVTHEMRVPYFMHPPENEGLGAKLALKHIESQIRDPALRAKVTPHYRLGCKRVLISDNYYPALERENVEVITGGASAIAETGVLDAQGKLRAADVIIYATGFKPMDLITNVEISGVGGRSLNSEWAKGPEAYLGTVVSGYPNFFTLMGPNSGLGHNSMIYMIESQIAFVMDALDKLDEKHAPALDVKPEVQRAFNQEIQEKLEASVWGSGCSSWYLSESGKNCTLWPDYTFRFRARTKHVREDDFSFTPAA